MSGRSSRHSATLACAVVLAAACGKHAADPAKRVGDPEKVRELARTMSQNLPAMAAVPNCKDEQLVGGATMTYLTLAQLAQQTIPQDPEHADWINPPELDSPAARVLRDRTTVDDAAREAAGELLAQPAWIVYRVDMVNAPIALAIKELKIGTVGTRIVRYGMNGAPICVRVFYFQNDKTKSDWAIKQSDKTVIDPAVAKAMRDDLHDRFVQLIPRGPAPAHP